MWFLSILKWTYSLLLPKKTPEMWFLIKIGGFYKKICHKTDLKAVWSDFNKDDLFIWADLRSENTKNDNFGVFVTILRKISLFMQSFYMQNHDPSSLKPPPKLIKIPDLARFWFYLSRSSSFKIIQVQSTSKKFPSTMRLLNIYFFEQKRYHHDSFLPIFGRKSR